MWITSRLESRTIPTNWPVTGLSGLMAPLSTLLQITGRVA
jgi:hypothetical protein